MKDMVLQKWCSCFRGWGRGWYGDCLEFSICGVSSHSFNFPQKTCKLSQPEAQSSVATQTLSPVTELSPTPVRSTHKSNFSGGQNRNNQKRPSNDGRAKCGGSRRRGTTQPWEGITYGKSDLTGKSWSDYAKRKKPDTTDWGHMAVHTNIQRWIHQEQADCGCLEKGRKENDYLVDVGFPLWVMRTFWKQMPMLVCSPGHSPHDFPGCSSYRLPPSSQPSSHPWTCFSS